MGKLILHVESAASQRHINSYSKHKGSHIHRTHALEASLCIVILASCLPPFGNLNVWVSADSNLDSASESDVSL
jgi:hypothetical protein